MPSHDAPAASAPSRLQLPPGPWASLLDGLCARFPAIGREVWRERFARGRVLDAQGHALAADEAYRVGIEIRYFREVEREPVIPFEERVLYRDERLLVADKPHFLPVIPAGGFVAETLLGRLQRRYGETDLAPLHRLDRGTAGVVMFSRDPATRDAYQSLFRERRIRKRYEALAPPLPQWQFPLLRRTRLVAGEPFFLMREAEGEANSETRIDVIERGAVLWRYALEPVSGRKHQLRVHMAGLGAAIVNDRFYPLAEQAEDDFSRPLKLLARELAFVDPIDGRQRRFESGLSL
ncbi:MULTISPECIES: pseudouridine synthase [unclassified Lysobacter]|uniref:pseudouridine synthase n=1 Tax=unclassified Lysobacter TaxID=2635362 RepID=UPI001BE61154|nr:MULTISPECIES: pseudouridine synthase [unclassified Lysobacter]MBT2748874.1 pseudouridine synthase [Lysobacter sp. ISL-42]MBT2753098.1 pseudouridine synthase [Lysobacter sp. ISL-50]MBT2777267.1 pseudouridine synthase [Lysobacter sp. ISL-54]MBT2783247.1 pseudouridine synthase [Lysobacter sp. ISL-52]